MNSNGYSHQVDPEPPPTPSSASAADLPDGPLRILAVLARNLRLLVVYPVVVTILVVLVAFLFPNYYQSKVVILPPERSFQSMEQPIGKLAAFASGGMSLPMMATPSDILAAVLVSRSVRDSLVSHLDLSRRWGLSPAKAAKRLRDAMGKKVDQTGIVEVWATDTDRFFSDTLANAIVDEADRINRQIVNTKARRTREFVEKRLVETKQDLGNASRKLEQFQDKHRTVALEAQIASLIKNAAELKARITADQIEVSVLETSLSPEHYRIRFLRSRIHETQKRLDHLQATPSGDSTVSFFDTGFQGMPHLIQELAELTRDFKVAENVYTLLTEQYENARIQEHRDTPSFSVLDRAAGGGTKVRPRRAVIGLATLVTAFTLVAVFVLIREYYVQLEHTDPARRRALRGIWESLWPRRNRQPTGRHGGSGGG